MALSLSPRKVVPLATGEETRSPITASGVTKRVFFCGVVIEGAENGKRLPEDVQDLVLSLGEPLTDTQILSSGPTSHSSDNRQRALTDSSALKDTINELVTTERTYVKRLRILKFDYADPLRKFSRSKDTSIIPPYEAKTLFGNVDNLLPVNEAFLTDLEKMLAPNGSKTIGGVGDVALKHFKTLRGFEHYKQYYIKREEAQTILEREMNKRASGFAAFIDRIKYSSADTTSRVGLRELLIEPVQRIPRYTLLFRTMIKYMPRDDPQRQKLIEADEIASKIALAETDEPTTRAATMYCLSATVDGFPPALISNSRQFIDCIDVVDTPTDFPSAGSSSMSMGAPLHCSLFLFDDKLLIVKRPSNAEKGGRALAGLEDLHKLTKAGGLPIGKKKSGMTCKGVVDVCDVVATDVGTSDFHLYLESPPQDQTERWSGRPFRSLCVVNPPAPINLDPTRTESDKKRFLENLWSVQAKYRAKLGQSVVLRAEEKEVESRGGRVTWARTYYNVYQRTAFLQEVKKTKVVVHVDANGTADPIPFGMGVSPFVVIRLQPLAGDLCRYTVKSSDPNDETEEDIVQTGRVPSRIVQTIHQYGLFKFQTGNLSMPSTPTASMRSRTAMFGLDAISRNLFNARPGSSRGDFFGGSINSSRRSKSVNSRSSIYTQTTTTADSSMTKFSHRSNSTTTVATSVSNMDDDESFFATRSASKSSKYSKRGRSPGGAVSDSETASSARASIPVFDDDDDDDYSDGEEMLDAVLKGKSKFDESEQNLALRLELARRNSQNQYSTVSDSEAPVEDTIFEEETSVRPVSRASKESSHRSTTPRPESSTPTKGLESPRRSRSISRHSAERRPLGPRSPSPLPPPKSPMIAPVDIVNWKPAAAFDLLPEDSITAAPVTPTRRTTAIPRSKRQPFFPTGNTDTTPKANPTNAVASSSALVEPLSIKKKTSLRTSMLNGTPSPSRKSFARNSPLNRPSGRIVSPRRVSLQKKTSRPTVSTRDLANNETADRFVEVAQTTREDIESSRRSVKKIKLEIETTRSKTASESEGEYSRPSSPEKLSRTPQRGSAPMTKAAQDRMLEMRQLINRRQGEGTPKSRPLSVHADPVTPRGGLDGDEPVGFSRRLEELVTDVDRDLSRAATNHDILYNGMKQVAFTFKEKSVELEKTKLDLQNTKRQCELVKSLLADATAEKEIMYEAFNEELDGMYNDANLPHDEAWIAMSTDLRETKEARNLLSKENSHLKRRMAETELQNEEWGALLRAHGLIP